MSLKKYCQMVV